MDCLLINGYGIDKAGVGFHGLFGSNMDDNAAREDACREYQSSLEDLTFNSKPHINMLTILAEENLNFAKDIVAIIEAQITKAPSAEKLPVLYLVDSIVKNVGGEYLAVFAKNLITSFICVFEKVDENTRKSLFKLRSTWDDVFPLKKLYALDVRVNSLDPAWPIKSLPPTGSIHVNPKFLKQAPPPAVPAPPPVPAISQSSLTQEQIIRQQLLAKQKQLLELQQKKIELELEQTKAQLAGGFVLPTSTPVSTPVAQTVVQKPVSQTAPVVRPWIPPSQTQTDTKPSTRDPRLNRAIPPAASQPKEQLTGKKESPPTTGSPALTPEKRLPEKPIRPEKPKTQRKDVIEEKSKSKSPSPLAKNVQSKNKQMEAEIQKSADSTKKDPRLRKRMQDKTGEAKDDELKEKKRCSDKKERGEEAVRGAEPQRLSKGKLVNGSVTKHDRDESIEKAEFKTGGNARTHARKRTRSRSRSRSPTSSPKRKDRRSPKSRARSSSLSPTPSHKSGQPRRIRTDEPLHVKPGRDDRPTTKKNQSESRRLKRPVEDRHSDSRDSHSPRSHDVGGKETKEALHRWRSGWEENKHVKLSEDSHVKPGPQRHKPYSTPTRPTTPRTSKHRLSVDANLQIPDVLNSASKKDLIRRASKRLESGEISQDEFLNVAHKIKHFFQYQEEKQQRSDSWDDSTEFSELSYYEHKSKLKKTQVTRHPREWNSPLTERQRYDREEQKSGYDAPRRYAAHPDPRRPEGLPPSGTVVHRNCPSPVGLDPPAPRFERERLSPLHQKESAESPIPRFESPNSEHSDDGPLNLDVASAHPHAPPKSILKVPPRGGALSSVRQHGDSPGHTPPHDGGHPPSRYEVPGHMGPSRPHPPGWYEDSPQFEGPHHPGPGRFDGGGAPHPNMQERFDDPGQCDGPPMSHGPMRGRDGMGRFDGHPHVPGRVDGHISQQPPVRFVGQGPGPGAFEGPMQRFDPPRRFDNLGPGPGSGPMGFQQQRPLRLDFPMRFDGPGRFEGPGQPGPMYDIPPRFSGPPGQQGPTRFAPQHNMQPPMRPMAPPMYDNSMAPQQNFNMAPQHFSEPMNPQFPAGPMQFPAQPNLQQAGNFNMQPAPAFNQPAADPFYNAAAPAVGMQQPVNMMGNMTQPFLPQNPVPFRPQAPQVVAPENHFGQVDVNDLLSKLISTGIIKPSQPDAAQTTAPPVEEEEEEEQEVEEEDIPDLTSFSIDDMKQRYESVVTKLYSGNQCCLCSMRFTTAQTDMYADHLDWHFRQNHAGKVASKKVTHRRWYYSLTDWIEFEEIADLEERAKSQFFEKENEEEVQKNQAAAKEKEFQSVRATKDQVGESCEICQEPFETYWVEEEEDWFLKNAVRVDDKNFHPSCFEDYKNSCVDVTPSPNKVLADHPLSAFIKTEEEEEGVASCSVAPAASVKQEVDSDKLPEVKEEEEEVLTENVQSEENKP
uniref:Pre-mRNA cleavage complex 2 protein Pcf11 n=1 Tax=Anabas testudineus TaxID=64144 RepID=A0A7N6BLR2_ANATE